MLRTCLHPFGQYGPKLLICLRNYQKKGEIFQELLGGSRVVMINNFYFCHLIQRTTVVMYLYYKSGSFYFRLESQTVIFSCLRHLLFFYFANQYRSFIKLCFLIPCDWSFSFPITLGYYFSPKNNQDFLPTLYKNK